MVITHVETTSAPASDDAMTAAIHAELERKALLPAEHIVDTGYVDAKLLVESQWYRGCGRTRIWQKSQ